jgi:hypothetical protein
MRMSGASHWRVLHKLTEAARRKPETSTPRDHCRCASACDLRFSDVRVEDACSHSLSLALSFSESQLFSTHLSACLFVCLSVSLLVSLHVSAFLCLALTLTLSQLLSLSASFDLSHTLLCELTSERIDAESHFSTNAKLHTHADRAAHLRRVSAGTR